MKIVVTGGGGFIGDHVVKELRNRDHEAVILDRSVGLDVRTYSDVKNTLKGAFGVIHLAGILGTEELFHMPHHAVRVNIEGGLNVILACVEEGVRFVYITMPHVWNNIYQATKQAVEHFAAAYHDNYGLEVCNVRAFNVYGEGQKVGSPQKIIPTFSDYGWRGIPLPIWGDGDQQADLIHVGEVSRMLVDALDFSDNRTLDAGTGVGMSVLDIADTVLKVTGSLAGIQHHPMRLGEKPADVVAKGEGWDALDWKPQLDRSALVRTIESYRYV